MDDDNVVAGRKFGQQLIEAFGLEGQHVVRLELVADATKPAIAIIHRILTAAETRAAAEIATEYTLVQEVTDLESENREWRRA